jgi:hypothetical protein
VTPKLSIALPFALLIHLALFAVLWLSPRQPKPDTPPTFVAADGLFKDEFLVDLIGPSVCPVHNVEMMIAEVPIVYGLLWEIEDPAAYRRAHSEEPARAIRHAQFPHAEHWAWGGCCVAQNRRTRIYICSECERVEQQWKLSQSK